VRAIIARSTNHGPLRAYQAALLKNWVKSRAHPAILRVKVAFERERQRTVG
jgi:hypothetical protein